MHKQEPERQNLGDDNAKSQTKTGLPARAIAETMNRPEFDAEQLPALWQQAREPGGMRADQRNAWRDGIETMFRRCSTYPQHTKLTAALFELPPVAWYDNTWIADQAHSLLRQATPKQLVQAIKYEQRHHPDGQIAVSNHIATWAKPEQITERIIKQLDWNAGMAAWSTTPDDGITTRDQWWHIRENIKQQLLGGDDDTWTVFLGIVEHGNNIGETAELAIAIGQQHRPVRNET